MNTTIRRCMISDAHAIYELCRKELGYDFSEEQVVQNVRRLIGSPENLLMVAVDSEDKVLGFIHANNHDPIYAPPMKDIVAIAVNPEFRHHGLGRRLILAVEDWARETGAKGVRANSDIRQKKRARVLQIDGLRIHSLHLQRPQNVLNNHPPAKPGVFHMRAKP